MSNPLIKYKTLQSDTDTPLLSELPRKTLSGTEKAKVLKYLSNGNFISAGVVLGEPINAMTGETMPEFTGSILDDGVWYWQDTLICYVKDYDVALPDEFVTRVMEYFDNGGAVRPLKNHRIVSLMSVDEEYKTLLREKLKEIRSLTQQDAKQALEDFVDAQYIKFCTEHEFENVLYL